MDDLISVKEIAYEVFLSLKKGEEYAFKIYFEGYYTKLINFVYKIVKDEYDAEEVVSESFMKLFKNYEKINDPDHVPQLLYTIARNLSLNSLRSKKNKRRKETEYFNENSNEVNEESIGDELNVPMISKLKQSIETLPLRTKEVIKLLYLEKLSRKEVAKKMNIAPATVKSQRVLALTKLRSILGGK